MDPPAFQILLGEESRSKLSPKCVKRFRSQRRNRAGIVCISYVDYVNVWPRITRAHPILYIARLGLQNSIILLPSGLWNETEHRNLQKSLI